LAIKALEEVMPSEDAGKIKGGVQNLTDAAMKLGEAIYKNAQEEAGNAADSGDLNPEEQERGVDEDIVDADFEDLGDEKRD
jgi:molecular chaperone DnaK